MAAALHSNYQSSSAIGFSVGLPTSDGGTGFGMATSRWVGGPFWC